MLNLSSEVMSALDAEVSKLAMCWKLTRRDAVVQGFTDHDRDIVLDGVTYIAASGIGATAITSSLGLKVDNLELEGLLSDDSISQSDILAGKYDYAQIDVWLVPYEDTSHSGAHLKTGWLGEITMKNGQFIAEVRGLSSKLQASIGEVYTPTCRASFGDARCGYNLSSVNVSGSVSHVEGQLSFLDGALSQADGFFDYGSISFLSGANAGLTREIKRYAEKRFSLIEPLPYALNIGDNFEATAGCDKRFDTCCDRFNNALNFRGEPHVPGTDSILKTAATR